MQGKRESDTAPLEPSSREHGVSGYTESAVGGFGEDYSHQVASGEFEAEHELSADPNDLALSRALQKALASAHIDAAALRIDVHAGDVTLYGTVRRSFEKTELEAKAREVSGVRSLTSRLTISHESPRDTIP
ncbi:MAG: BON domain-containing protein [Polyangiaceae bacterium]